MKRNYSKKVAISLLASLLLLGQNIEANTLETISAQTHQIITYGDEEERERKVNPYAFEIILPDYIYVGQVIPIDFIFADYPRTSKEDIMDIRVAPVEPPGPAINPVNRPLHLHNQSYVIKVDVPIYPYNIYETHYYLMAELPLIGLPIEIGYIMIEATTRHFVTARRIQVRPIYYLEVYESHVYMSDSHDMHQFRVIPRNYHGMDISEWLPHLSSMPLFRLRWSLNHLLPNTPANISQSGLVTLTRPFLWNHLDRFRVIAEYDPIAQGPILNGLFMHGPRSLHAIGVQESDFSLIHENHVRNMSIYGVEFNIIDGIPHGTHFGNALLSQIINGIRFGGLGAGGTVSFNVTYAQGVEAVLNETQFDIIGLMDSINPDVSKARIGANADVVYEFLINYIDIDEEDNIHRVDIVLQNVSFMRTPNMAANHIFIYPSLYRTDLTPPSHGGNPLGGPSALRALITPNTNFYITSPPEGLLHFHWTGLIESDLAVESNRWASLIR